MSNLGEGGPKRGSGACPKTRAESGARSGRTLGPKVSYVLAGLALISLLGHPNPLMAQTEASTHSFTVENQGKHSIQKVYLSATTSDSWGEDRMGEDEILPPGRTLSFSIDTVCVLDIRIVYTDGIVDTKHAVDTCKYDLELDY